MKHPHDYPLEELLPLLSQVTAAYTSFESSSVTYETAEALLNGIIYTLNENFERDELPVAAATDMTGPTLTACYRRGYQLLLAKAETARSTYHQLLEGFQSFGVKNYAATIRDGLPDFFRRYDPRFKPQNHLLTLDYPTLVPDPDLSGIDLIAAYLVKITQEDRLLRQFTPSAVVNLLITLMPDYRNLYLDNLCYPVLLMAVLCVLAERPAADLELTAADRARLRTRLTARTAAELTALAGNIITRLCRPAGLDAAYFTGIAPDFARRWESMLH